MGRKTGRPPKPTALKRLTGTLKRSRVKKREPTPVTGAPDCPESLRGDDVARAHWHLIVPQLAKLKLLARIDSSALEGYCRAYSMAVAADREVDDGGILVQTLSGLKANPAIAVSFRAWAEVRHFATEFGLTPASRSRISVGDGLPKDDEDNAEEFLFGAQSKVVGSISPA
jgi:P27 family predicted phage terminase small subunit